MKLIFMGTPDFAVSALKALLASKHQVLAVYTQPPRPAGRGQKLTRSPVHELAEKHNLPVHTPVSLKDEAAQKEFAAYKADAAVVSAYGLLLPPAILDATPHGCINIHPSLLPRWRGAAPIQRAVMAGDTETGVCIMLAEKGMDTGPVFMRGKVALPPDATSGKMYGLLSQIGADLLLKTLQKLEQGGLLPVPQGEEGSTYAKKVTKADSPLNWYHPAKELHDQVRGLSPVPFATAMFEGTSLKIHAAEVVDAQHSESPGTVLDDKLTVACGKGALRILALQKPGGKPMATADFLRGFPIPPGSRLLTGN